MRTREEVEQTFIDMINKFLKLGLEYPLPPDISLIDLKKYSGTDTQDLDSIDVLELVIQIEEVFGVPIEDKEIKNLMVWSNLIDYITNNQKNQ